jgi:hypothetical protein
MFPGTLQALSFAFWGASLALALDVAIPLSPPSTANRIAGDHVSFSLEQDRWLDWSGTTSRNDFFFNTLDNLRQLSGVPPQIRIGANSQDRTNFNPNIDVSDRSSSRSLSYTHAKLSSYKPPSLPRAKMYHILRRVASLSVINTLPLHVFSQRVGCLLLVPSLKTNNFYRYTRYLGSQSWTKQSDCWVPGGSIHNQGL